MDTDPTQTGPEIPKNGNEPTKRLRGYLARAARGLFNRPKYESVSPNLFSKFDLELPNRESATAISQKLNNKEVFTLNFRNIVNSPDGKVYYVITLPHGASIVVAAGRSTYDIDKELQKIPDSGDDSQIGLGENTNQDGSRWPPSLPDEVSLEYFKLEVDEIAASSTLTGVLPDLSERIDEDRYSAKLPEGTVLTRIIANDSFSRLTGPQYRDRANNAEGQVSGLLEGGVPQILRRVDWFQMKRQALSIEEHNNHNPEDLN